jgi:beta-lactamase class A
MTARIFLLLFLGLFHCVSAQTSLSPLEKRVSDVAKLFRNDPSGYDELFTPDFLSKVPSTQLTNILSEYYTKLGLCIKTSPIEIKNKQMGRFMLYFERGFGVPIDIAITADEPYLIAGLFIGYPTPLSQTLDQIIEEIKKLPGATAFLVAKLEKDKTVPIASHNPDRQMAIGSTSKLYVLAELIRAINAREKRWDEVTTLQSGAVSLPSGILQDWPVGSPITLHSLAVLMISLSDNTATDQLLQILGREKIEKVMSLTGHNSPEKNMPFLSTLEMFKLKGDETDKLAEKFIAADLAKKRDLLGTEIAQFDRKKIVFSGIGKPRMIEKLEWFASANDLANALNWIRQNTEVDAKGREILAINPGLDIPHAKWRYIGYKGGSEPGVLNLTYLLQSHEGVWYAVIATWNNEKEPLEEGKLFSLITSTMQILK